MGALRSRDLINAVLFPHVELAADLLRLVNSLSTDDQTHRYQDAALIVFLAGVDKALSLSFQLMYLAGVVDWGWLKSGRKPKPGVIECDRGLTAKLGKLCSLGLDLTDLQWMVDLRNAYVHSCSIYAGYGVTLDDSETPQLTIRASGPELSYSGYSLVPLGPAELRRYGEWLADRLGCFLDGMEWREAWLLIAKQLECLPVNPEPEYSQSDNSSPEEIVGLIDRLNERHVGEGFKELIGPSLPYGQSGGRHAETGSIICNND